MPADFIEALYCGKLLGYLGTGSTKVVEAPFWQLPTSTGVFGCHEIERTKGAPTFSVSFFPAGEKQGRIIVEENSVLVVLDSMIKMVANRLDLDLATAPCTFSMASDAKVIASIAANRFGLLQVSIGKTAQRMADITDDMTLGTWVRCMVLSSLSGQLEQKTRTPATTQASSAQKEQIPAARVEDNPFEVQLEEPTASSVAVAIQRSVGICACCGHVRDRRESTRWDAPGWHEDFEVLDCPKCGWNIVKYVPVEEAAHLIMTYARKWRAWRKTHALSHATS